MQTQDAIQQAIEAMKGMNQDARNTLVTVVMAIVDNNQSDIATLHQNAPKELVAPLAEVLNSMAYPKNQAVNYSQIEASLKDAEAIADLMANCEMHMLTNPKSLQIASALVCEIIQKAGGCK